jgi:hypothetical protein
MLYLQRKDIAIDNNGYILHYIKPKAKKTSKIHRLVAESFEPYQFLVCFNVNQLY